MGIIKITIFQKNLQEGLNLTVFKKLAALKSDFLLLPEYFFVDQNVKDQKTILEKSQYALDWLTKLSESYRGIILGGSILRKEGNNHFCATPIVSDNTIIDWYKKRSLSDMEKETLVPGNASGILILKGHRFAILSGEDIRNQEYIAELVRENIRLLFVLSASPYQEETLEAKRLEDEEFFLKPAREHGMYIVRCSSVGQMLGQRLQGRSLLAVPQGLSWRVSPDEEHKEILKNVTISVPHHFVAGKEPVKAAQSE